MRHFAVVVLILYLVVGCRIIQAQTDNEFWFAIPHATWQHTSTTSGKINAYAGGSPAYLRICCSGPATVTVSIPASNYTITSFTNDLYKDTIFTIDMSRYMSSSWRTIPGGGRQRGFGPYFDDSVAFKKLPNGLYIQSVGSPITAYWDLANGNNRDLMSLKGYRALGKEFYIPMQNKWDEVNCISCNSIKKCGAATFFNSSLPVNATNYGFSKTLVDTARGGFDIVATANGTNITIYPTADLNNGVVAGSSFSITLNKGETYSVVIKDNRGGGHLGGTRVVVTNSDDSHPIAITVKDDSAMPLANGYDYLSDQLTPINIIGREYIVTSGQLVSKTKNGACYNGTNLEQCYITITKNGTTLTLNNGGTITTEGPFNAGEQFRFQPPPYTTTTNTWAHIQASDPVYVFQTTGFEDEPGAALIPKIDGCTGSQSVSVVTPTSPDSIYFNILAFGAAKDSNIHMKWYEAGVLKDIVLKGSDFVQVGSTNWYIYNTKKNSFAKYNIYNRAVTFYTAIDRFHLGMIAGSSAGAKFGYFSNFSEDRGTIIAQKGNIVSPKQVETCFGDTIMLITSGGHNHRWYATNFGSSTPLPNIYISSRFVSNPSIFPPPGNYNYIDSFSRPCWPDTGLIIQVTVNPKPIANFDIDNEYVCTPKSGGAVVNYTNRSIGANGYNLSFDYPYVSPKDSSLLNISHTYPANLTNAIQTHTVRLEAMYSKSPRCRSVIEKTIRVLPRIEATFSPIPADICDNINVNFENNSSIYTTDLYKWDFNDGSYSTARDTSHVFRNLESGTPVVRNVKLLAISPFNCRDSMTRTISVSPYLFADFEVNGTSQACSPMNIGILNQSFGYGTINYDWNYGDGATRSTTLKDSYTKPYTNAGAADITYTISLNAYNTAAPACPSSKTKSITVFPKVDAAFTATSPIAGCNPLIVGFANTSINPSPLVSYSWDFGDGTSESGTTPANHTFNNTTDGEKTYKVKLTTVSNHLCEDADSILVTSYARMDPGFTIDKTRGCGGINAKFVNTTQGGTGIVDYIWNFGDVIVTNPQAAQPNTFTHNYSASSLTNYNIFLTVSNGHPACNKSTPSVPVTIYPGAQPIISPGSSTNGCTPLNVSFINGTDVSKTEFMRWEFGDGESSSDYNTSHTYVNNSTTDAPLTAKLIAWSINGCKDTAYQTINVYSKVEADFNIASNNLCTYEPAQISDASIGNVSKRYWQFENCSDIDSTKPLSFPKYFENYNLTPQNKKIQLIVKNNWYCPDTAVKYVLVNPHISAEFTPNSFGQCDSTTFTFISDSNRTVTSWKWEFDDGASATGSTTSHLFYHLEPVDKKYTVMLQTKSDYNCVANVSKEITSYAYIDARFAIDESEVCSGFPINIDNFSPNGATRNSWYFGDGLSLLNTNNGDLSHLYNNEGIVDLKLVVRNNHDECVDSAIKKVTIHPKVIADISSNVTEGCDSLQVTFYNNSNAASKSYLWSFGDGSTVISSNKNNIKHTYFHLDKNSVNYKVKMTALSDKLCYASDSVNITAYSYVKAAFSMDKANICSDFNINFTNNSSEGVKNCYWDFDGDGNNMESIAKSGIPFSKPFTNYNSNNKDFRISLVSYNDYPACADTVSLPVTIYPKVVADFSTYDNTIEGCNPLKIIFNNESNSVAKYFSWDFGDSTSSSSYNSEHIFENKSSSSRYYDVKLTATSENLCTDFKTMNIKTYPFIDANFKVHNAKICSGDSIKITENTPAGVTLRKWDFDERGTFVTNNSKTFWKPYINKGQDSIMYKLKMVAFNDYLCSDTIATPVTIFPEIVSDFTYTQNDDCTPSNVEFKPNISNADIDVYNWTFGDGNTSNIKEPEHDFVNNSSFDRKFPVSLYAVSKYKCKSISWDTVLVRAYIEADFKIPNSNICSGIATLVVDTSLGEVSSRSWRYTKGPYTRTNTSGNNFMFKPTDNLTSDTINGDLWLTVKNAHGCSDSIKRTITIFPKVLPSFYTEQPLTGCSPYFLQFRNTTKNANDFNWYFGEGGTSTLTNPEHIFYNFTFRDTAYIVKLIAVSDYKCKDSTEKTVSVFHKPSAEFSVEKTIDCSPFNVVFKNNSRTTEAPGSYYTWDFGDGVYPSTIDNHDDVTRTFLNNGPGIKPYKVFMKAGTSKGCLDTTSLTINVYPKVTAKFDTLLPGCTPAERKLVNNSVNANYYVWKFENEESSLQKDPNHVFFNSGTVDKEIKVELVAESEYGCKDSVEHYILVYPSPDVNFSVNPTLKYYPDATFSFMNLTPEGPWTYDWDFNDNKAHLSERSSFDYKYEHWGKYKVVLTAKYGNCSDSSSQDIILNPPMPKAVFDSSVIGCEPITVFFKNRSEYADTFIWDFGDGKIITKYNLSTVAHTYTKSGIYNVKLTVKGDGGKDHTYQVVEVLAKPEVDFEVKPTEVMLPFDRIRCFNKTQGAIRYLWRFGEEGEYGNDVDTLVNPTYKYSKVGTYTIKLTAWSAENCSDSSDNVIVQVIAPGVLEFPNAFMPNASGPSGGSYNTTENSVFYPYSEGIAVYHLEIFNRWGEMLFISNDINVGWDGYYKGKLCPQGVYVYKAKGKFLNGSTFTKAGDVTLLYRKGLN